MAQDLKAAFIRSRATFLQDLIGALSLIVMLMVGLHLPNLL